MLSVFACLSLALCANAPARTATPKSYVDTRTRNIDGGRKVLVVIPQFSIGANFEIFTMGPLVGMAEVLIDQKLNNIRASDAGRLVAPLASALGHYDFDGSLYAGLMPTIKASPWLRGQDVELTQAGDADSIEPSSTNRTRGRCSCCAALTTSTSTSNASWWNCRPAC